MEESQVIIWFCDMVVDKLVHGDKLHVVSST